MRRLHTHVQKYAWGKKGCKSKVAKLKKAENADYAIKEDECYAELWMGTHPNGPSRLVRDGHYMEVMDEDFSGGVELPPDAPGMFLIELLELYPTYLGELEELGDLPFLFKILSINKALSIQAHPDKKLAARVYATRPDIYKDDNHKPEMAVALSQFEGLCGFRPFREIVHNLKHYPELRAMVGQEAVKAAYAVQEGDAQAEKKALESIFVKYIHCNTSIVDTQVMALVDRLRSQTTRAWRPKISFLDTPSPGALDISPRASSGMGINTPGTATRKVTVFDFASTDGQTDQEETSEDTQGEPDPDTLYHPNAAGGQGGGGNAWGKVAGECLAAISAGGSAGLGGSGLGDSSGQEERWAEPAPRVGKVEALAGAKRALAEEELERQDEQLRTLMLRLADEYPGDIGILMPLLLNYLRMGPGESFFMAANEPHAYLRGDLMEVMARSDNVVRVALTPKYRDVPLLCEILTYNMGAPPMVRPVAVDNYCRRYSPPIKDFELEEIRVPAGHEYVLAAISVPALIMVLEGKGEGSDPNRTQVLWSGAVFFIPAYTAVTLRAWSEGTLHVASAHTNLHYHPDGDMGEEPLDAEM